MSNHSGSYMLNEVIEKLNDYEVFQQLGKEKSQQLVIEIVRLASRQYDCNSGEILDGHAELLHICYQCVRAAEILDEEGVCPDCHKRWG